VKIQIVSVAAAIAAIPFSPVAAQAPGPQSAGATPAATEDSGSGGSATAADSGTPPVPGDAKAAHPDADQAIVITGVKRPAGDLLGGVSVVDKELLQHEARPSIGETLASQPGVTSSSFGPTASRPILRGLSGERVRILVDGIGTLDLSSSDPDHQVTINPLTADRIEVLRGPSALLFGSSAIGGVVNVIDTRIPRSVPDEPVRVSALAEFGSAADERSGNLSLDLPLGANFVAHADGAYSKYDDLDIRGFSAAGAAGNLDAVRHFDTTDQLRTEIVEARLWGGIHYRFSTEAGVQLGRMVAHYGLNHAFKSTR